MPLLTTRRLLSILVSLPFLAALVLFKHRSSLSQQLLAYPYPISRAQSRPDYTSVTPDLYLSRRFSQLAAHKPPSYDESLKVENIRCPHSHLQTNQDQLKGEGEGFWKQVTVEQLIEARQNVMDRVREMLQRRSIESLKGNGQRGLVFTAGNGDTLKRLLVSLRLLRNHGCQLPVEIFGFKHEIESLESDAIKREIDSLGNVTWKPVSFEKVQGAWKQFHIKGEAIASSSFSEVLYLDSDNIVVTDPTYLFDSPVYKEHGIVLWPDYNRDAAANPIWRLLDTPCNPLHWQVETGQLLIDKRARKGLNAIAMEIVKEMNRNHEFWFRLSGGDKDTFRYAFYFVDLPFTLAPYYPSSVGSFLPKQQIYRGHDFCSHTMMQYGLSSEEWDQPGYRKLLEDDPTDAADNIEVKRKLDDHAPPLFVHANLLKHSGGWNQKGSTFVTIKKPSQDLVNSTSLSQIRQTGFPVRGICSDIWSVASNDDNEIVDEEELGASGIETMKFRESYREILRDFEEKYWEFGGRTGGW